MPSRWKQDTTIKFVENFLRHECLWNENSDAFSNELMKQSALADLRSAMNIRGFSEFEIKLKMKAIRARYRHELKRINDSKSSGAGRVYTPTLKWFSLMYNTLQPVETLLDKKNSATTKSTVSKQKKRSDIAKLAKKIKKVNCSKEESEFDVFGKHVSVQLKSLPMLSALETQESIQLEINKARRQYLRNKDGPSATFIPTPHYENDYMPNEVQNDFSSHEMLDLANEILNPNNT